MIYNVLKKPDVFYIGKQDENNAETIDIDYSAWVEKYGEGVITATFQGAEDENPYDIVLTTANGIATWTVTKANTAAAGAGKLQLNYIVNDVEAKSLIWTVRVYPSMRASGEAPDGYQDWLTALQGLSAETQQNAQNAAQSVSDAEDYADQAKASADSITGLTVEAETLPAGSSATASFDADTDKLSLGIPRGDKGEKGDAGQDGVTPDLTIGTTETLPAGSSATATITGTKENPVLNLGIPQGIQGIQGERGIKGDTGATPDISIGTVETLNPDESATATITGTAEDPVLNLGIPKGDTGADGFSPSASITKQDGNIVITVTDKDGTTSETLEVDDALDETSVNPVQNAAIVEAMRSMLPVDTASGAIASFPDGADDVPMLSLKAQIEPVQEGSGDPSPDNVRPISGHTGVTVTGAGENIIQRPYYDGTSKTVNGVTFTVNSDGSVTANGAATANAEFVLINKTNTFYPAATYTLSGLPAAESSSTFCFNTYAGNQNNSDLWDVRTYNTRTFTAAKPIKAKLFIAIRIFSGYTANNLTFYPQLEPGTTATDYEAFQGESIPISWESEAGTVYGGTLDVVTGKLTVDRAMVDLGTRNYVYVTSSGVSPYFASNIDDMEQPKSIGTIIPNILCSAYKPAPRNPIDLTNGSITADWTGTIAQVQVKDLSTVDAAEFKTKVQGVQLVYRLKTPQTYQLTPQEVRTFLGANNIWSDTGDTEVTYRADIAKYIEKKVNG